MTIDEMETLLRIYLDDPSTTGFTQATAFNILNQAFFQLYNEMVQNNQEFFSTTSLLSLIASTEVYTLPSNTRVSLVERVDLDREYPVPIIPYVHRSRYLAPAGSQPTGYETKCYIRGNSIGFVPIPPAAVANAIRMTVVPPPTAMTTGQSPPTEWSADNHEVIVLGGLLRKGIADREERRERRTEYNELKAVLIDSTSVRQSQEPKFVEDVGGVGIAY